MCLAPLPLLKQSIRLHMFHHRSFLFQHRQFLHRPPRLSPLLVLYLHPRWPNVICPRFCVILLLSALTSRQELMYRLRQNYMFLLIVLHYQLKEKSIMEIRHVDRGHSLMQDALLRLLARFRQSCLSLRLKNSWRDGDTKRQVSCLFVSTICSEYQRRFSISFCFNGKIGSKKKPVKVALCAHADFVVFACTTPRKPYPLPLYFDIICVNWHIFVSFIHFITKSSSLDYCPQHLYWPHVCVCVSYARRRLRWSYIFWMSGDSHRAISYFPKPSQRAQDARRNQPQHNVHAVRRSCYQAWHEQLESMGLWTCIEVISMNTWKSMFGVPATIVLKFCVLWMCWSLII